MFRSYPRNICRTNIWENCVLNVFGSSRIADSESKNFFLFRRYEKKENPTNEKLSEDFNFRKIFSPQRKISHRWIFLHLDWARKRQSFMSFPRQYYDVGDRLESDSKDYLLKILCREREKFHWREFSLAGKRSILANFSFVYFPFSGFMKNSKNWKLNFLNKKTNKSVKNCISRNIKEKTNQSKFNTNFREVKICSRKERKKRKTVMNFPSQQWKKKTWTHFHMHEVQWHQNINNI